MDVWISIAINYEQYEVEDLGVRPIFADANSLKPDIRIIQLNTVYRKHTCDAIWIPNEHHLRSTEDPVEAIDIVILHRFMTLFTCAASILQMELYCLRWNRCVHSEFYLGYWAAGFAIPLEKKNRITRKIVCNISGGQMFSSSVLVVRGIFRFFWKKLRVGWHLSLPLLQGEGSLHQTKILKPNENRDVGSFAYIRQSLSLHWTLWFPSGDKCFLTLLLIPNPMWEKTKIIIHNAFVCLPTKCFRFILFFGEGIFNWFFSVRFRVWIGRMERRRKNVLLLEFQCDCRDMNNGCVMCVIDVLPEHALFVYMS